MDDYRKSGFRILQDIVKAGSVPLETLEQGYNLSRSQLRYRLHWINEYLAGYRLPELVVTNDSVLVTFSWSEFFARLADTDGCKLILDDQDPQIRQSAEIIYIFCADEELSVFHFQSAFKISKNTVIRDLKQIRAAAAEHSISLRFSRQQGYFLGGRQESVRNFVLMHIDRLGSIELFSSVVRTVLHRTSLVSPHKIAQRLWELFREEQIPCTIEYLNRAACLLSLLFLRGGRDTVYHGQMCDVPRSSRAWSLARKLAGELAEEPGCAVDGNELPYIALLLGYAGDNADLRQELLPKQMCHFEWIAAELIYRFSLIVNVQPVEDQALIQELSRHLLFASFCAKYDFPIVYPKLLSMKRKHNDVFCIVNMLLRGLRMDSLLYVCEDETAFIVSYLLKILESDRAAPGPEEQGEWEAERIQQTELDLESGSVHLCIQQMKEYCDIRNETVLRNLLKMASPAERRVVADVLRPPKLKKVLKPEYIQMMDACGDWKTAVRTAAEPLLREGAILPGYVDEMIGLTLTHGTYYEVFSETLIPHAYSSQVRRLGFSLLRLKQPVYLLDMEDHPIRLVIVIAALDNKLHQRALGALANILSDNRARAGILDARHIEDIVKLLYG